jgi:hypothetical protein
MKYIKLFELFDTEDLKYQNEIDFLSGKFNNIGKKIDIDFKGETIGKLIKKIGGYHFPFFEAFIANPYPKFNGFEIYSDYNKEEGYWSLVTKSDNYDVVFGIRPNSVNSYDLFIYFNDNEAPDDEELSPGVEYDGLTFDELIPIIKNIYIPFLIESGFESIIDYNADNLSINN